MIKNGKIVQNDSQTVTTGTLKQRLKDTGLAVLIVIFFPLICWWIACKAWTSDADRWFDS